MILGCGIDLVEVARFERERVRRDGDSFDDVLTPSEMAHSQALRRPVMGYAAGFAAKEACFKALGTGKVGSMSWHDLEVGREEGRYTITLGGETAEVAHRLGVDEIHLSLASTRAQVVALVVVSGRRPTPYACTRPPSP
ncbi:MAG: holo-ACP synthase [Acidobacteria bacterium]|nr:holo-ACP synthase [Acidobacteriota bacterium]